MPGEKDGVRNRFPRLVHTVIRISTVLFATLAAALRLRGIQ